MNLSVQNVGMTYPTGKMALQTVNIEMQSPNFIGLLGPNGAGKSTLMKLLVAGLLPTSGQIQLDGLPLKSNEKNLKKALGYLPQDFGLYDELTVWKFLDYMAALKGIRDSRAAIEEAIRQTNLTGKRRSRIRTLSGGQRQRVGIAQALLGSPELLIFDEPTVGLDPEERIHFRNLFSETAQNRIVLLSTHIIEDIQSVCNRLIVLNHGQILFDGAPDALIRLAEGHVGVFEERSDARKEGGLRITSRINTASGIACRVVGDTLPSFARLVEPSLEDAYMYLIEKEAHRS